MGDSKIFSVLSSYNLINNLKIKKVKATEYIKKFPSRFVENILELKL